MSGLPRCFPPSSSISTIIGFEDAALKKSTLSILTLFHWQTYICIYFIFLLYKHPRACTNFLKMYDEWACTRKFNITQYKVQPSLILRRGKIVACLNISTTRTNCDDQCDSMNRTGMDWRSHGHTSNHTFGRTKELKLWYYFYTYWDASSSWSIENTHSWIVCVNVLEAT